MAGLDVELSAYRALRSELEKNHFGKWVVFRGTHRVGIYDTFEIAARDAIRRFGRGPYLIREIGAQALSLPAGAQRRDDGRSPLRI